MSVNITAIERYGAGHRNIEIGQDGAGHVTLRIEQVGEVLLTPAQVDGLTTALRAQAEIVIEERHASGEFERRGE